MVVACVGIVGLGAWTYQRLAQISADQMARNGVVYDPNADAHADIQRAIDRARREQKLVLLDFGADWCIDCVVLARHFEDPRVKPYLDAHFVVVRVNVGAWDVNLDIARAYGDPIAKGIPAVVVITPDQRMVVSTGGGELANARLTTNDDILVLLKQWVAQSAQTGTTE